MPLIKKPSKQAFEHNMKAEMHSGKPQNQSLAIAYDIKRRNAKKKMAKGGMVESAKTESRPMPEQRHNDSTIVSQNEPKAAPMPRPKMQALKHDSMVNSKIIKAKRLDAYGRPIEDEQHIMSEVKPMKHEGMSEDKGPSKEEYMKNHFAKGGMINDEISMEDSENDELEHPARLEEDNDQMSPSKEEIMEDHFADGGMVDDMDQPQDEADEDQHDSIAAAIMAKRSRMAEGGMVDIEENAEEEPNSFYNLNEDAALKENYDDDMMDMSQPEDSNEHGDNIDSDEHDMISKIRSKMNMKRQFKV